MARATRGRATGTTPGTVSKQAVVVIHGIGEQVPLETLRSFVETVYQRDLSDPTGRVQNNDPDLGVVNQVWAVPDDATGTAELRRISTPPSRAGLRTDFFEFYWADIMEGTPIEEVYGWMRGLLLRSPFSVPRDLRVWLAWILLWGVAIALIVATLATLDPTSTLTAWMIGGAKAWLTASRQQAGLWLGLIGTVLGAARFLIRKPARAKVTLPLGMLVIGVLLMTLPAVVFDSDKVWSAVIAALLAALLNGVVAPYAGDIVRYVRATPATVDRRKQIRERGVKLLTDLHVDDPETGRPNYDRVVIVAHSLGTVIGYDLIQQYWEQEGPTHHKPPMTGVPKLKALDAVDDFVRSSWVDPDMGTPFPIDEYQRRQGAVSRAVTDSGLKFRITDFITLGAALTHADFLLADDGDALKRSFDERYLSSSPPRPDWPAVSMIYRDWATGTGPGRGPFIHFAAPFAAVRWTNLYDKHWLPLFGDIVSGPLTKLFGPGIADKPVAITRPRWLPIANRLFTHTLYWTWDQSYANGKEPEHIRLLRDAIRF